MLILRAKGLDTSYLVVLFVMILLFHSCTEETNLVSNNQTNQKELGENKKEVKAPLTDVQTQTNTKYKPYQKSERTDFEAIPKEIEKKLIQQGTETFDFVQAYDLESLDYYAPTLEEMEAYYKIFDPVAFQNKWNYFQKNYQTDGLNFGENLKYDQDLIRRITARGALLRAKSLSLTNERVQINENVELNKVYIKQSKLHNDFYDIHIRFKKKGIEEYYEMVNEACWLTDRTCINTSSWKFLGKYIPLTGEYHNSELNWVNK